MVTLVIIAMLKSMNVSLLLVSKVNWLLLILFSPSVQNKRSNNDCNIYVVLNKMETVIRI